jgi:predicted nuclease of predicted toxin-antitoxin system
MKFKVDENLPIEIAEDLRSAGHDALTVGDQLMSGRPDKELARVCHDEERALVTLDLDFANLRDYPPADHFGIIVLRPNVQTIPLIRRLLEQVVRRLSQEPLVGSLWIVDPGQIRIRSTA